MEDCQVFWAFNKEQLQEGIEKAGITKDNKMVSIGMGGYIPSKNLDKFLKATKEADELHKKELKEFKQERAKAIAYELVNHECYYNGDITPVVEMFKGVYSKKDIMKVYQNNVLS